MRRRRAPLRRNDTGLTLVELSVSMMIIGVLSLGVGTVTVGTFRAIRIATVKISTGADARIAMETLSRPLRVAVLPSGEPAAITVGSYDAITFYALLSRTASTATPLPTLVEFYRDAASNCLMEALTPARVLAVPVGTSLYAWDTGRSTHCVARTSQVPSAAQPWFSYYTSGQLVSGGSSTVPLTVPTGGLLLSDRQNVRSVAVSLTVTDPSNPTVGGVSDEVRVTLGNVSLSSGGSA
ncbi:MAG TPA: prepilin-type N-terminal cleavage/methylation domain-containing protein [Kineosporiaceae bacterium]|nr:prepilin-type N-terminal cleavage/methylation domain-containing protein [Kineosporiaceae bacterium]